ncbi:MAG: hypothetical protein BWY31_02968 [Lentisphaerae bacterium ADurb.Bin242]|nr:MAG: hypothetical protein BWY31_02968 [Lentisphaerae bacterium ADurb.Bin242]
MKNSILFLLFATGTLGAAELRNASIELPETESREVRLAARELAFYSGKITGTVLPFGSKSPKIVIRTDPSQKGLVYDGYRIASGSDGGVVISGRTPKGTEFGVYAFLEELGVRFYLPGVEGTYIPRNETLKIPALFITSNPAFQSRYLYVPLAYDIDWHRHNRMLVRYHFHHNLTSFIDVESFGKAHPEYFAWSEAKKQRIIPAERAFKFQPCMTNKDVIELISKGVIEFFNTHPEELSIDLGMNDGTTFCQCPECSKINGPFRKNELGLVDYSRLAVHFYNAIAEKLAAVHPDKCIGILGYNNIRELPQDIRYHPNVIVGHVMFPYTYFDPASKVDFQSVVRLSRQCKRVGVYAYTYGNYLIPSFPIRIIDRFIEDLASAGVTGWFSETTPHWPVDGIKHYLLMKKLWNPALKSESILREFARDMFGRGEKDILEFYEIARQAWEGQKLEYPWANHMLCNPASQLMLVDGPRSRKMLSLLKNAAKLEPNAPGQAYLEKQIRHCEFLVELNTLQEMWKEPLPDKAKLLMQHAKVDECALKTRGPRFHFLADDLLPKESILALGTERIPGDNLIKNPEFEKTDPHYLNPVFLTRGRIRDWELLENWGGKRRVESENGILTMEGLSGQLAYPPFPVIWQKVAVEPMTGYRFSIEYKNSGFQADPYTTGIAGWHHFLHTPAWKPLVQVFRTAKGQTDTTIYFGLTGLGTVCYRNPRLIKFDAAPEPKKLPAFPLEKPPVPPEPFTVHAVVKSETVRPVFSDNVEYRASNGQLSYDFSGAYNLRVRFPDAEKNVSLLIRFNRTGEWKNVPVKDSTALIEPPECTTHIDLLYRNTGAMIEFIPECR